MSHMSHKCPIAKGSSCRLLLSCCPFVQLIVHAFTSAANFLEEPASGHFARSREAVLTITTGNSSCLPVLVKSVKDFR